MPFDLPANIRDCATRFKSADLNVLIRTGATRGDLLNAFGQEATTSAELRDCLNEAVRLVDVHNVNMEKIGK